MKNWREYLDDQIHERRPWKWLPRRMKRAICDCYEKWLTS